MILELETYFERIRDVFFLGHTIGGYSFESLSKEGGQKLYTPSNTHDCIKALEEYVLDRKGADLPDRKRILKRVLLDTEKLIDEIESMEISPQLDFSEGELTEYDYLHKVDQQFLAFRGDLIKLCQEYEVDGFPTDKENTSFPGFFENKEIPELCKNIFNRNDSPTDYAVMFCLLQQKGIITIPPGKRVLYYKAWYKYIDKPEPASGGWTAINKHFGRNKYKTFRDEGSDYFKDLKKAFDQAIKDKLILL